MDCVVSPVLHVFPFTKPEVSVTLSPAQNVPGPLMVINGALGTALTFTVSFAETAVHPLLLATVTE